ncbi:hypothetical protein EJ06DRAFT_482967 [Trichodelitschia bisporula]|uniref:Uncharacterized protein n=1 Tax=Trichodelitschia bisporula TaxID=703511 RepID=A0A6G1HLT5_9PEZI|nr:hypothetical protein EJ06DRAFT_482967 [Trichodelitschia bisporula]
MPFLRLIPVRTLRTLRPQPRAPRYLQSRALSLTPRWQLKEDGDRSPEQLEKKKQEQIEKQKKGEGHWHEELASSGETAVKADREDVDDHGEHVENLQQETVEQTKGDKGR